MIKGEPYKPKNSGYMANKPKSTLQKWAELMKKQERKENVRQIIS